MIDINWFHNTEDYVNHLPNNSSRVTIKEKMMSYFILVTKTTPLCLWLPTVLSLVRVTPFPRYHRNILFRELVLVSKKPLCAFGQSCHRMIEHRTDGELSIVM